MQSSESRIALLIDADNAPAAKIDDILVKVEKYGMVCIRRAYGNWKKDCLKHWADCLSKYAICPVQQFDYVKGKNSTDVALTIDAMDLLHSQKFDAFAIVSSDADFTPLVVRLINSSVKVYGFGEQKSPSSFVSACSSFFYLDAICQTKKTEISKTATKTTTKAAAKTNVSDRKTAQVLKQDTKLIGLLRKAIAQNQENDQWAPMSRIGSYLGQVPEFSLKQYKYASLSSLFEAIDLFEVSRRKGGVYVRSKKQ